MSAVLHVPRTRTIIATINIYSDGSVHAVAPTTDAHERRKAKLREGWHRKYKHRYKRIKAKKLATIALGLHPCEKCGDPVSYVGRGRPPQWCARHSA